MNNHNNLKFFAKQIQQHALITEILFNQVVLVDNKTQSALALNSSETDKYIAALRPRVKGFEISDHYVNQSNKVNQTNQSHYLTHT